MNEILLWVAAAWVLAMVLVFALLDTSIKQDRAAHDEELESAARLVRHRWLGHG